MWCVLAAAQPVAGLYESGFVGHDDGLYAAAQVELRSAY